VSLGLRIATLASGKENFFRMALFTIKDRIITSKVSKTRDKLLLGEVAELIVLE